jgi:hypothetical protein
VRVVEERTELHGGAWHDSQQRDSDTKPPLWSHEEQSQCEMAPSPASRLQPHTDTNAATDSDDESLGAAQTPEQQQMPLPEQLVQLQPPAQQPPPAPSQPEVPAPIAQQMPNMPAQRQSGQVRKGPRRLSPEPCGQVHSERQWHASGHALLSSEKPSNVPTDLHTPSDRNIAARSAQNESIAAKSGYAATTVAVGPEMVREPATIQEALAPPAAECWQQAMMEELKSLHTNRSWELEPLPSGRRAVEA